MTLPSDLNRLRHLRDAATKAIHYASGRQRSDLDDDEVLRLALTKLVEIVDDLPALLDTLPDLEN